MKVRLSGTAKQCGNVSFEIDDLAELHIIGNNERVSGLFRINQDGTLVFSCVYAYETGHFTKEFKLFCNGRTIETSNGSAKP
jgi:hypothetical protein